jgi:ATP-dependent NAD(P)H-hydrate dehydratase
MRALSRLAVMSVGAGASLAATVPPLAELVRQVVPELHLALHKGQSGRVLVVGGSVEYTGAPYYAAIASLKGGGDLAWVVCGKDAAGAIKAYSPELIVLPALGAGAEDYRRREELLPRVHALVVGPGLGRDAAALDAAAHLVARARQLGLPLVVDGDGLFLVALRPDLVQGYAKALLTPNKVEFSRLWDAVMARAEPPANYEALRAALQQQQQQQQRDNAASLDVQAAWVPALGLPVAELAAALGGVTVLQKGELDLVADGLHAAVAGAKGSPRRCGGQGDVLAGSSGLFLHWAFGRASRLNRDERCQDAPASNPAILAALGASALTRTAGRLAFAKHKRAMTTPDLIHELGTAGQMLFPTSAGAEDDAPGTAAQL